MCEVCDKKVSKAAAIVYRIRISGRAILVHPDCEMGISSDTRAVREG
jgi:hypothetical protein